jgi:ribosomal protein L18E
MAKTTSEEEDLDRLKKKIETHRASASPDDKVVVRRLRKRLKRAQRKKRRLAIRRQHALGKKAGSGKEGGAAA